MAGELSQGAFGGAITGLSAGAPLGPFGMAAGGAIGLASGLFQGQNAKRLEKQYQQAEANVQTTDPGQTAFLQRLRQQERNYRAGTDASSAFAAQQARNVGSTTQANLLRAGGPGAVSNLLRAQAGTNNAMANIGAQASQGANQMLGLQGGIVDQIAQRNFMRQRERRNQAMERSVSARQNIQNMFSGALAMVPGMTAQLGQGQGTPKQWGFDPMAPKQAPGTYDVNFPVTQMQPRGAAPLDPQASLQRNPMAPYASGYYPSTRTGF